MNASDVRDQLIITVAAALDGCMEADTESCVGYAIVIADAVLDGFDVTVSVDGS